MAGINAARQVRGEDPLVLDRSQAYIGIMIDDLVTKGTNEPYRMFTSRAEFRLNLRIDNADLRLTPVGRKCGLVDDQQWKRFEARRARIDALGVRVAQTRVEPSHPFFARLGIRLREKATVYDLLKRPEIRLRELAEAGILSTYGLRPEDVVSIETEIKYEGYLKQQERQIERLRKAEDRTLPADLDYATMPGLSAEAIEKLSHISPQSIGQASRIPGITPAALSILLLHLEIRRNGNKPKKSVNSSFKTSYGQTSGR